MKVIASLATLALATPAFAQTPPRTAHAATPAPPNSPVTRDLNSGPPAPATYLAPPPTTTPATPPAARPAGPPAAAPATSPPHPAASAPPTIVPAATRPAAPHPTTAAPVTTPPHPAAPAPSTSRPAAGPLAAAPAPVRPTTTAPATTPPRPAVSTPSIGRPVATPPSAVPVAIVPAAEVAPPPPSYTVLDAPARAALPFMLDLPADFTIDAERSGPDFKMYAVRRNGAPFVMIYAGPSSQFPIYDGELVQAAGRSSMVVTEDGQRHAMEHLFQRSTSPQEIHSWVASLEGADRALAERIAQSVDVR